MKGTSFSLSNNNNTYSKINTHSASNNNFSFTPTKQRSSTTNIIQLDVKEDLIPYLVHQNLSPELFHDPLEIYNRYHQLIMKLLPIPTLIHRLEIFFLIIMITNHLSKQKYHYQYQHIQDVEVDLDHYLIIKIDIEIVIITHPQIVNLNHQSIYHILIITFLLLKNNDRIQKLVHGSHGRTHIPVQNLMGLGSTPVIDLHLVITHVLLITIIVIREHDPVHSHVLFHIR